MKKKIKIITILVVVFMIVNIININISLAINPDSYTPTAPTTDDAVKIVPKVGVVLGAIRNITVVVAVIVLMIIGFKYIIGSVEEKANYKATMWPYIIGCILAICGTTIVNFIYNAVK